MGKHAYLIIAHKNDKTFKTLIEMLDYKDNDIFIHMDAKLEGYRPAATEKLAKKSRVFHAERTDVHWGGYSQINAEMVLLKKATETGKYDYYHLISGEDLPIKTQKQIHEFFDKNKGKEFVTFYKGKFQDEYRVRYWYPFQEKLGRKIPHFTRVFALAQRPFVHRNKGIKFQKGTNWFSITDDFARYVVSQEDWVKRVFRKTWCCDEVFLYTLLINSPFMKNVFHHKKDGKKYGWDNTCGMRLIDWERGAPYTFRSEDYEELMKSEMCFARKFDAKVDAGIIDKLKNGII
jgi:hypothetical protein